MTQHERAVDEVVTQFKHLLSQKFVINLFDDVYSATGSLSEAQEAVRMLAVIKRQLITNTYEPKVLSV